MGTTGRVRVMSGTSRIHICRTRGGERVRQGHGESKLTRNQRLGPGSGQGQWALDSCQDLGSLTEQRPGGQREEFPPRAAHLAVLATGPRSGRQWSDGGAQVCTCLQARTHGDHRTSTQPTSKLLFSLSLWPVWVGLLPLQDRGPGTQKPSCQVSAHPDRWICVWRTAFMGGLSTDPGSQGLTAPGTQIKSGPKGEAFPQFGDDWPAGGWC